MNNYPDRGMIKNDSTTAIDRGFIFIVINGHGKSMPVFLLQDQRDYFLIVICMLPLSVV